MVEPVLGENVVIYPGTVIGAGSVVGDLASIRERVTVGEGSVVGRGVCVENDTVIGARCRIQSNAYITAYSLLEDDVFVAPCVDTTNDNFMGRTEARLALMKGCTLRRGCRIGGGATLLPGIEVGEEAFVGAGAVVLHDVPARQLWVGNPARYLRDVPAEQLLG